jgi:hypothetical protein
MANRVLAVVRRMLDYGVRNDWLDASPASLIDKPEHEVSRERVLRTTRFGACGSCCPGSPPPRIARRQAVRVRKELVPTRFVQWPRRSPQR